MMKYVGKLPAHTLMFTAVIVLAGTVLPQAAHALSRNDFDPGHIISNGTFTETGTMSVQDIQNFLNTNVPNCDTRGEKEAFNTGMSRKEYASRHYGDKYSPTPPAFTCLKNYYENPDNGNNNYARSKPAGAKSAARIIHEAANKYDINPQVLLVTLQKEQSIITDDWPWEFQYKEAMGYGCFDDGNGCRDKYAGFSKQIDYAAWQFRQYLNNPSDFLYGPGERFINYNPDGSCGGSDVVIENKATSALYNYTPYQPNKAALDRKFGGGSGDACSTYGNLNFWIFFNQWFGDSTQDHDVLLLKEEGEPHIYLIRGSKKIRIATPGAYKAWGFNELPVVTVDSSTINDYTPSTYDLRRFGLLAGTNKRFFVDGQNGYRMSRKTADAWEFKMDNMPAVPKAALDHLDTRRKLSYLVNSPVSSKVYMMDGGTLRHYPSSRVLRAWEADTRSINITEQFFCHKGSGSDCTRRWTEGSRLGYPKARDPETGKVFFVNDGNKHWLSPTMNNVYAGRYANLSQATLDRFFDAKRATALLSRTYDNRIHLLNGRSRHYINSPRQLNHWEPNGNGRVTNVSKAFLNMLNEGGSIDRYVATEGGRTYYMKQKKYDLNDIGTDNPIELRSATVTLYGDDELDTPIVTSPRTDKIFLLGDQRKHHVTSIPDLKNMRNNTDLGIMNVPHSLLKNIETGARTSYQFTNGNRTYVFDSGSFRRVESEEWSLDPNLKLNNSVLETWFNKKEDLGPSFRVGDQYGTVKNGALFTSNNKQLGALWSNNDSFPSISQNLASRFEREPLSPFAKNPHGSGIYIYDGTELFRVPNVAALRNLGWGRFNGTVKLTSDEVNDMSHGNSSTYILDATTGVMDGGQRRHFRNSETATNWGATGDTNSLARYSDTLTNLLKQQTNSTDVSRLITSSGTSKYYCMYDGEKRWLTGSSAVNNSECSDEPLRGVSHKLLKQIPTGESI